MIPCRRALGSPLGRLVRPLLLQREFLLPLFPLRVPLSRLQHEHADQDERENRVTGRQDFQTVLSIQRRAFLTLSGYDVAVEQAVRDDPHALNDVGDVDNDGDRVQSQTGAVEQHVRVGGAVQLDEEAEEARSDYDVEHAGDQGWGVIQEGEVRFEPGECFRGGELGGPQEGVIIREEREEDAEEKAGCCDC